MVECDCDGDRVVCTPKTEAEMALDLRHFPDCIAGCECNPMAQAAVVEDGYRSAEEGAGVGESGNVVTSVAGSVGVCNVANAPAADTQKI